MDKLPRHLTLLPLLLLTVACGGGDAPPAEEPPAEPAAASSPAPEVTSVTILEPAEGATVSGATVIVRLETAGVPIVPAGDMTPGTGHHHLFLDADQSEAGVPIPSVPGSIVHMGNAAAEYTFENVAPGTHRLIAVVGDGAHVPLQPWVVDTVTFQVQ